MLGPNDLSAAKELSYIMIAAWRSGFRNILPDSIIEKYKTSNPTLYENLVKRIKKESIFPRYVICTYYADYYSNIKEMRESFKNDWNELGFSVYKEHDGDMQPIFTSWGV